MQPLQQGLNVAYGLANCPDDPASILNDCGDNIPCLYSYALLNSKIIANEEQDVYNAFFSERQDAIKPCNHFFDTGINLNIQTTVVGQST